VRPISRNAETTPSFSATLQTIAGFALKVKNVFLPYCETLVAFWRMGAGPMPPLQRTSAVLPLAAELTLISDLNVHLVPVKHADISQFLNGSQTFKQQCTQPVYSLDKPAPPK